MDVRLSHLRKRFGSVVAVDDVTLEVESGELFFILGPSGCGKTTCLRIVAGFVEPDAGTVFFDDRDVTHVSPHRRNTGMVFQNYALWPHMSVRNNVSYGLDVRGIAHDERRRRVTQALDVVRMADKADRYPNQLSGGEQQRVALARALVIEPDVLLLDEPLSNLDAKLRHEMRQEIRRIHDQLKLTALYVTHDQKEALSIADRLAVMRDGRIAQVGAPRDVYMHPADVFVATFLGEANLIRGHVHGTNRNVTVDTPIGELVATKPLKTFSTGVNVVCCIRPEAILMTAGASPQGCNPQNNFSGRVESVAYLGEMEQYVVRVRSKSAECLFKVTSLPTEGSYKSGEEVELQFSASNVAVLEDAVV